MMMSLRFPDSLVAELEQEARRLGRTRSELARQAVQDFLAQAERRRRVDGLVSEMQQAYGDPTRRTEALDLADAAVDDGLADSAAPDLGAPPASGWWR